MAKSIEYFLECVGPGWRPTVKECLEKIIPLGAEIQQVKEKFGGLRVYYRGRHVDHDKVNQQIRLAEMKCETTCEDCGAPGEVRDNRGWLRCLCDQHLTERENIAKIME